MHMNGLASARGLVTLGVLLGLLIGCSGGGSGGGDGHCPTGAAAPSATALLVTDPANPNLAQVTAPDGTPITFQGTKDAQGHFLTITSAILNSVDGNAVTITYDAQGRPIQVARVGGGSATIDYSASPLITVTLLDGTGNKVGVFTFNPTTNTVTQVASNRVSASPTILVAANRTHSLPGVALSRTLGAAVQDLLAQVVGWAEPRAALAQQGTGVKGVVNVTCGGAPLPDVMVPPNHLMASYIPKGKPPTPPGGVPSISSPLPLELTAGGSPGRFLYEIPFDPFVPRSN